MSSSSFLVYKRILSEAPGGPYRLDSEVAPSLTVLVGFTNSSPNEAPLSDRKAKSRALYF